MFTMLYVFAGYKNIENVETHKSTQESIEIAYDPIHHLEITTGTASCFGVVLSEMSVHEAACWSVVQGQPRGQLSSSNFSPTSHQMYEPREDSSLL